MLSSLSEWLSVKSIVSSLVSGVILAGAGYAAKKLIEWVQRRWGRDRRRIERYAEWGARGFEEMSDLRHEKTQALLWAMAFTMMMAMTVILIEMKEDSFGTVESWLANGTVLATLVVGLTRMYRWLLFAQATSQAARIRRREREEDAADQDAAEQDTPGQ